MLKKTINYTDYDGNPRSETYYFHLTKAEISEMEYSNEGGLEAIGRKMIDTQDQAELVRLFKDLILKSYGERIGDAKNFIKLDEEGRPLSRKFMQTAAYDALWMELINDTNASIDFFNGIVPKDMSQGMHKELDKFKTKAAEDSKAEEALPMDSDH